MTRPIAAELERRRAGFLALVRNGVSFDQAATEAGISPAAALRALEEVRDELATLPVRDG